MKKTSKNQNGFSLIEIIVIIVILGIMLSAVVLNFRQSRNRAVLEQGQASIINALELAKNRASSGVGEENHGVRIEQNEIIIFEGGNEESPIPLPLNISASDLEIIFERISARPNMGTTINITHNSGLTESIIINESGVVLNP